MFPHGKRDLINTDDMDAVMMSGPSRLVECCDDAVVEPPHRTGSRINNEHAHDNSPRNQIGKIPPIDTGIDWDGLSDSFSAEFHHILGRLEVSEGGTQCDCGRSSSRCHGKSVSFLQCEVGSGRIARNSDWIGGLTDDAAAGGHCQTGTSDEDSCK